MVRCGKVGFGPVRSGKVRQGEVNNCEERRKLDYNDYHIGNSCSFGNCFYILFIPYDEWWKIGRLK